MILRETASVNGITVARVHEQTSLPTFTVFSACVHIFLTSIFVQKTPLH